MAPTFNTQSVYGDMKLRITKGQLAPGSNLREGDLSQQYKVSRNTVKKALLMLERDRYITIEPNKGAKVRSFSLDEVLQFLELREELEGFITRKAAENITDEQLAKLKQILDDMKKCKDEKNLLAYSQHNQKFHELIYTSCPNILAVDLVVNLKNQMLKYNTRTILVPGRSDLSFKEHLTLFDALKRRDPKLAEQAIRQHLHNVREVFNDNFALLFGWGTDGIP
ncbi:MAG: GntR family transcriptional regulator [Treponema sp.]|jgi:DNA-binding GntR family transcriptional regulator|nr:GntR family transcriptional regulator [Treponema sp.]